LIAFGTISGKVTFLDFHSMHSMGVFEAYQIEVKDVYFYDS